MKHLFFIAILLILNSNSYANSDDVLDFAEDHSDVITAIEQIKHNSAAESWGSVIFSKPEVELLSEEYSSGNTLGGNGSTKHYVIKFPYSINMDWNGYSDTMMVFVSSWSYSAMKFPGQTRLVMNTMALGVPASKGMKIKKIIKSVKELN